jgi:prepilin-type N-terminal cleavage/methylation domain-containing protein
MNRIFFNRRGFTLIEIITSLVVLSIIGVIAGMGMVSIAKGYVFTKKNAAGAQKAQIAMARIVKELAVTDSISSGSASSITFNSKSPPAQQRVLFWNNTNYTLSIDSDLLLDNVSSFNLAYYKFYDDTTPVLYSSASTAIIQVTIGLKVADDNTVITFVDRVFLLKVMTGIGT